MSVIFKSLTKLRSPVVQYREGRCGSAGNPLSPFGRKAFVCVGVAFLVTCAGFLAVHTDRPGVPTDLATARDKPICQAELLPAKATAGRRQESDSGTPLRAGDTPGINGRPDLQADRHTTPETMPHPVTRTAVAATAYGLSASGPPEIGVMAEKTTSGLTQQTSSPQENPVLVVNAERRQEIMRLISRLQRSVAASDLVEAQGLVDHLASLKPENDPFVLKLRAYLAMLQDRFDEAQGFLQSVLSQNQEDLEAGINLAICEINTDKIKSARERLLRLREQYPENTQIADLFARISG